MKVEKSSGKKSGAINALNWRNFAIFLMVTVFPWGVYMSTRSIQSSSHNTAELSLKGEDLAMSLGQLSQQEKSEVILNKLINRKQFHAALLVSCWRPLEKKKGAFSAPILSLRNQALSLERASSYQRVRSLDFELSKIPNALGFGSTKQK